MESTTLNVNFNNILDIISGKVQISRDIEDIFLTSAYETVGENGRNVSIKFFGFVASAIVT